MMVFMELVRKVRWQRESSNGKAVPYMFEELKSKPGYWTWVRYNVSKAYKADKDFLSKGYASFINAKKCGYKVVEAKL